MFKDLVFVDSRQFAHRMLEFYGFGLFDEGVHGLVADFLDADFIGFHGFVN